MYTVDLASEIYRELGEPHDLSLPSITQWLRFGSNLGSLNNLIHTNYVVSPGDLNIIDGETADQIGLPEAAIYAQIFYVYYYQKRATKTLESASYDRLLSAESDGGQITFLNRTTISQTYIQLKKEAKELLATLVNRYRHNAYTPLQIVGDDLTTGMTYPPLYYGRYMILT